MNRHRARRAIADAARSFVDGSAHAVDVCRTILSLSVPAELEDGDELDVIRGVESQTEDYPLGDLREKYSPDYLRRVEAETEAFLARMRPALDDACRRLMSRLEGPRRV
jgi:hypothetical protein